MPRETKTRRKFIKTSAGIVTVGALAGCTTGDGGGGTNGQDGEITGPFRLRMWHEKYGNSQIKEFAKKHNIEASNKGFSDPAGPYSKLQSNQYAGDNISFIHNWGQRAWKNDLLQPINTTKLSNFNQLDERWRTMNTVSKDKQWGIPYDVGIFPITYNKDTISSSPKSWDILWDPKYKGRITMQDSAITACQIAALYTGQNPIEPDDFQDIKEALKQQKPLVKVYWGTFERGMRLFVNGSVDVGQLTVGRTVQAAVEHSANVDYTVPKEGGMTYYDEFTIPKNAKHTATSYAWIDDYLKNSGPKFTKLEKYRATTKNLNAELPDDLKGWYKWPKEWKLITQELLKDSVRKKYDQIWTEIKG